MLRSMHNDTIWKFRITLLPNRNINDLKCLWYTSITRRLLLLLDIGLFLGSLKVSSDMRKNIKIFNDILHHHKLEAKCMVQTLI